MKRVLAATVLMAFAAAACSKPAPPRVRVAAAADLNAALGDLVGRFSASHAIDVTVSYGSSGTFYTQLLNEAPFDLFLSADVDYPRQLAARGLTLPGGDFSYAVGRLVVWVPAASPIDPAEGLRALTASSIAHVSVANPEHAPYGRAAIAAMKHEGIYDAVASKIVYGENVAQAMQFVQSGAADAGVVALSLALAPAARDAGRFAEVPLDDYPRMEQGGAILKWAADPTAARAFRDFIVGADGRAILKQYGFSMAGR
ncbi:MAG TPA: molybdate ABC transporter substrate-binding protein [Vicinamibacterales bacterium]|nr:molybdate ABC transporter substrate-binding protein [Vicinamibacterales bacterium]